MSHLLCIGLGYTAGVVADRCEARGWRVSGTSRSAEGATRIAARGATAIVFDGTAPSAALAAALGEASHVLVSVPPDADGDPVLGQHARDVAGSATLRWIGYLSTIGVYGDRQGGWVDETTPPAPATGRSRWRLAAERQWQQIGGAGGPVVQVFRLPGIYGPGRSAIDQLRAGTARRIVKPGHVFNRSHVADIATVVEAGMVHDAVSGVFNVADDEPAPSDEVVTFAAHLLGVAPPVPMPIESSDLSAMARSFYTECKRVSNRRIKQELGVELAYPTYREGLAAIAAGRKT